MGKERTEAEREESIRAFNKCLEDEADRLNRMGEIVDKSGGGAKVMPNYPPPRLDEDGVEIEEPHNS
mgnify:CR=1 FL=1